MINQATTTSIDGVPSLPVIPLPKVVMLSEAVSSSPATSIGTFMSLGTVASLGNMTSPLVVTSTGLKMPPRSITSPGITISPGTVRSPGVLIAPRPVTPLLVTPSQGPMMPIRTVTSPGIIISPSTVGSPGVMMQQRGRLAVPVTPSVRPMISMRLIRPTSPGTVSSQGIMMSVTPSLRPVMPITSIASPGIVTSTHTVGSPQIMMPPGTIASSMPVMPFQGNLMPLGSMTSPGNTILPEKVGSPRSLLSSLIKGDNVGSSGYIRAPLTTTGKSVMSYGTVPSTGPVISQGAVTMPCSVPISSSMPSLRVMMPPGAVASLGSVILPQEAGSYPMNTSILSLRPAEPAAAISTINAGQNQPLPSAVPTAALDNLASVVSTGTSMNQYQTVMLRTHTGTQLYNIILAIIAGEKTTLFCPSSKISKDQTIYARSGHNLNVVSGEGIYQLSMKPATTPSTPGLLIPKAGGSETTWETKEILAPPLTGVNQPLTPPISDVSLSTVSSTMVGSPTDNRLLRVVVHPVKIPQNTSIGSPVYNRVHTSSDSLAKIVYVPKVTTVEKQNICTKNGHGLDSGVPERNTASIITMQNKPTCQLKPAVSLNKNDTKQALIQPSPSLSILATNATSQYRHGDAMGMKSLVIRQSTAPCVTSASPSITTFVVPPPKSNPTQTVALLATTSHPEMSPFTQSIIHVKSSPNTNGSLSSLDVSYGHLQNFHSDALPTQPCLDTNGDNLISSSIPYFPENETISTAAQLCDDSHSSVLTRISDPIPDVLENDNTWDLGIKIDSVYSLADQEDHPISEPFSKLATSLIVPVPSEVNTDSAQSDETYTETESNISREEHAYEKAKEFCIEKEIKGLFTFSDDSDEDVVEYVKKDVSGCTQDMAKSQNVKYSDNLLCLSSGDRSHLDEMKNNEPLPAKKKEDVLDAVIENVLPEITIPGLPSPKILYPTQSLAVKTDPHNQLNCLLPKPRVQCTARKRCTQIHKYFKKRQHPPIHIRRCSVLTPKLCVNDIEASLESSEKEKCRCGIRWGIKKLAHNIQHDHTYSLESGSLLNDQAESTDTASSIGYEDSAEDDGIHISGQAVLEVSTITLQAVLNDPALKDILWKQLEPELHEVEEPMELKISNVVSLCEAPIDEELALCDNHIEHDSHVESQSQMMSNWSDESYRFRSKKQRMQYDKITLDYITKFRENAKKVSERARSKEAKYIEKRVTYSRWKRQFPYLNPKRQRLRKDIVKGDIKVNSGIPNLSFDPAVHVEISNCDPKVTTAIGGFAKDEIDFCSKDSDTCSPVLSPTKSEQVLSPHDKSSIRQESPYSTPIKRKKKVKRLKKKRKKHASHGRENKISPKIQMKIKRGIDSEWIVYMSSDDPFVDSLDNVDKNEASCYEGCTEMDENIDGCWSMCKDNEDPFKEDLQKASAESVPDGDTSRLNSEMHYDSTTTDGDSNADAILSSVEEVLEKQNSSLEIACEMEKDRSGVPLQNAREDTTRNLACPVHVLCVDADALDKTLNKELERDPHAQNPSIVDSLNELLPLLDSAKQNVGNDSLHLSAVSDCAQQHLITSTTNVSQSSKATSSIGGDSFVLPQNLISETTCIVEQKTSVVSGSVSADCAPQLLTSGTPDVTLPDKSTGCDGATTSMTTDCSSQALSSIVPEASCKIALDVSSMSVATDCGSQELMPWETNVIKSPEATLSDSVTGSLIVGSASNKLPSETANMPLSLEGKSYPQVEDAELCIGDSLNVYGNLSDDSTLCLDDRANDRIPISSSSTEGNSLSVAEAVGKRKSGKSRGSGKGQLEESSFSDSAGDISDSVKTNDSINDVSCKVNGSISRKVIANTMVKRTRVRPPRQIIPPRKPDSSEENSFNGKKCDVILESTQDTTNHDTMLKKKHGRTHRNAKKNHQVESCTNSETLDVLHDTSTSACSLENNAVSHMDQPGVKTPPDVRRSERTKGSRKNYSKLHYNTMVCGDSDMDQSAQSEQSRSSALCLNISLASAISEKENCVKPCSEVSPTKLENLDMGLSEQSDGCNSKQVPKDEKAGSTEAPLSKIEQLKAMLRKQEEALTLVRQRREESKKILESIDMI